MKHIFVVNLKAGQAAESMKFHTNLKTILEGRKDAEICLTKSVGHAEIIVRERCKKAAEDKETEVLRFYACGGDGTLNDVANGAYGFENVEIACIPIGTGNDFVRNFNRSSEQFKNVEAQIKGEAKTIDLIKYVEKCGETVKLPRFCINMFNIGFDCNVAAMISNLKKKPFIKGHLAYLLGVLILLVKMEGANLKIECDNRVVHEGPILLSAYSNGCYCGGGVKALPYSILDDNEMDLIIARPMSRMCFFTIFPKYKIGTHYQIPCADKYFISGKAKAVNITSLAGPVKLCTDGEISEIEEVSFEMVPKAIWFSVPADI